MQNWVVLIIRTVGIFFLTLVIIRIIGKGSLSKAAPHDFVSYTVISIIVSLMLLGFVNNIVFGFIVLGVWVLLLVALDYLSLKSKWVHDFVHGRETILIKNNKVMEKNMMGARITGEELLKELRSKDVFNLADVEFAVMESTGEINVLLKSEKRPVSSSDLQKKVAPLSEPQTVILDGNILDEELASRGLNQDWIKTQLSSLGVSQDNVFIGQVDSSGDLYIDLFDDAIKVTESKVKEMLYANIQKTQADFLSFALETNNVEAKEMYTRDSNTLKNIMDKLQPYLLG